MHFVYVLVPTKHVLLHAFELTKHVLPIALGSTELTLLIFMFLGVRDMYFCIFEAYRTCTCNMLLGSHNIHLFI